MSTNLALMALAALLVCLGGYVILRWRSGGFLRWHASRQPEEQDEHRSHCIWAWSWCGTAAMLGEELLEEPPHRVAVPVFCPDLDPSHTPPLVQQVARRNPPHL